MTTIDDRYLGDGVYASFDGYMIWLDLRGQDSTTRIALEREVFIALVQYSADVLNHCKAESAVAEGTTP